MEFSFLEEFYDFFFSEMREADLDIAIILVRVKVEGEACEAFVLGSEISVSPESGNF